MSDNREGKKVAQVGSSHRGVQVQPRDLQGYLLQSARRPSVGL